MSAYLNDLIQSLEKEAEEIRARLRTLPSRQPRRSIAEQNLKRIEQRLATLQELRLAERNERSGPEARNLRRCLIMSPATRGLAQQTIATVPSVPEMYKT